MGPVHVGAAAPDFELPDQDGRPVRLSSLRGQVVALAFATSWCPFSTALQPHLRRIAAQYRERNVRFLVVNLDETDAGYRRYVGRLGDGVPVLHDARAATVQAFVPTSAPLRFSARNRWKTIVSSFVVLDPGGTIRFFTLVDTLAFDAELRWARHTIDELLAASPTSTARLP